MAGGVCCKMCGEGSGLGGGRGSVGGGGVPSLSVSLFSYDTRFVPINSKRIKKGRSARFEPPPQGLQQPTEEFV